MDNRRRPGAGGATAHRERVSSIFDWIRRCAASNFRTMESRHWRPTTRSRATRSGSGSCLACSNSFRVLSRKTSFLRAGNGSRRRNEKEKKKRRRGTAPGLALLVAPVEVAAGAEAVPVQAQRLGVRRPSRHQTRGAEAPRRGAAAVARDAEGERQRARMMPHSAAKGARAVRAELSEAPRQPASPELVRTVGAGARQNRPAGSAIASGRRRRTALRATRLRVTLRRASVIDTRCFGSSIPRQNATFTA